MKIMKVNYTMVNFKTINKENNMAKKEKFARRIVPGKTALINGHKIPDPKLHQLISFIKSGVRYYVIYLFHSILHGLPPYSY